MIRPLQGGKVLPYTTSPTTAAEETGDTVRVTEFQSPLPGGEQREGIERGPLPHAQPRPAPQERESPLNASLFPPSQTEQEPAISPPPEPQASKDSTLSEQPAPVDTEHSQNTSPDQKPHPKNVLGKAAVEVTGILGKEYAHPSDWTMVVQSAAAAVLTFPVTWAVVESATGLLSQPLPNAILGMAVGAATYIPTFTGMSLYRTRGMRKGLHATERAKMIKDEIVHSLKFLGVLEVAEHASKSLLHYGLMVAGLGGGSALLAATAVTGTLGRVLTPFVSKLFRKKH